MQTKAGGFHYVHLSPEHSGVQRQQFPNFFCSQPPVWSIVIPYTFGLTTPRGVTALLV